MCELILDDSTRRAVDALVKQRDAKEAADKKRKAAEEKTSKAERK